MLRRVLLAAVAFSYLICVLVMSGMQKEDLDVGLLRKLERYNVNIDDKNNEELRQECTPKNKIVTVLNKDNNATDLVVTTDLTTLMTEDTSKSLNMETLLNLLSAGQEAVSYLDQTTENYTHIKQNITKSTTNNFKEEPIIDLNLLQSTVIKREQTSGLNKYYSMTPNNNFKINIENANNINNFKIVDDIFKNYLAQKNMKTTTTESTTRRIINIQSVYKQINELIANKSNVRIEEEYSRERLQHSTFAVAHNKFNNYNENVMHESYLPSYQDQIIPNNRNYELQNIYEVLNAMKQFKAYSSAPVLQSNKSNKNEKQAEIFETVNQIDKIKYEQFKSDKPESGVEINQKILSPNVVKQIAETFKDVVIKDLRKEISNIYFKPTQRTMYTTSSTAATEIPPPKKISVTDEPKKISIIDKFMELYDQIKALKQTTFVLRAHNKSEGMDYAFRQQQYNPLMTRPYSPFVLQDPDIKAFMLSVGNHNIKQNEDPRQNISRDKQFLQQNQYLPKEKHVEEPNQYLQREKQFAMPNQYLTKEKQFDEPNLYLPREKQYVEPNQKTPNQKQFMDSNQYLPKQFFDPNQYFPTQKEFPEPNQYLPKQFVDPNQYFPTQKQFPEPNLYLPNPKQFIDPNQYLLKEKHFAELNLYSSTKQQFVDSNQYFPKKQFIEPDQYLLRQKEFSDRNPYPPNQKQFVDTNQYTSRQNQFLYPNQYHLRRTSNRHSAKTIQTNSVEIKPLAISMPKFKSVISQNIIINPHNTHNSQIIDDQYHRQTFPRQNKYPHISNMQKDIAHKYIDNGRYGKHNAASNPVASSNQSIMNNEEDVIRFRMSNNGNSKIDTDYYEKINIRNNKNDANKPYSAFENRDIPRFHERLEHVKDDRVPPTFNRHIDRFENIKDDVTSREQLSLINLKKGSPYDETHFKNFLKTQQKVTDILEKILASKRNTSLLRSVEIA